MKTNKITGSHWLSAHQLLALLTSSGDTSYLPPIIICSQTSIRVFICYLDFSKVALMEVQPVKFYAARLIINSTINTRWKCYDNKLNQQYQMKMLHYQTQPSIPDENATITNSTINTWQKFNTMITNSTNTTWWKCYISFQNWTPSWKLSCSSCML